ncbi:baseplate J/gp47 family protein [Phreatobacter sp. HK31-P]
MNRFDSVDLSQLVPPDVIEPLDFERLNSEYLTAFVEAAVKVGFSYDVTALETDPVAIMSQAFSYMRLLDRGRVNDAAREVMLAFAMGDNLDHLAALYKVGRQVVTPATLTEAAVMEDDERLRLRVQLAPEALSCAGTRGGYMFHAFTADPTVTFVGLIVPTPGQVDVIVQAGESGEASPTVVENVRLRLMRDDIRPLTVAVTARAATIKPYNVTASLKVLRGPDAQVLRTNAEAALRAYAARRFRVGKAIPISGIIAALSVAGIDSVVLQSPASDFEPGPDGLARLGTVTLTSEIAQ